MVKAIVPLICIVLGIATAHARVERELSRMEGWCIVAVKTIEAYIDDDGKKEDGFQGCQFNRKIVFTDGTYLTCGEFGYQYAFRPEAVIFARNVTYKGKSFATFKMLVEDEMYDMQQ